MQREIVLDTETTGLDALGSDRLVEIGCVELLNGQLTGNNFHQYINPERDMPQEAFAVHGLSTKFLSDKPVMRDVAQKFIDYIGDDTTLVIHNAKFDIGFINAEFGRLGYARIGFDRVVDTLMLARRKFPGSPSSLDALCKHFGIDNTARTLHGALLDAELLAEVYIHLTGGSQAALNLENSQNAVDVAGTVEIAVRSRPVPLAARLTAAERAAHAAFVAELGDDSVWAKISSQ